MEVSLDLFWKILLMFYKYTFKEISQKWAFLPIPCNIYNLSILLCILFVYIFLYTEQYPCWSTWHAKFSKFHNNLSQSHLTIWDLKRYMPILARNVRQGETVAFGIHFSVKTGKFRVPYFNELPDANILWETILVQSSIFSWLYNRILWKFP